MTSGKVHSAARLLLRVLEAGEVTVASSGERPWAWTGVVRVMLGTGRTQLGRMGQARGLAGCCGEKGLVWAGTLG